MKIADSVKSALIIDNKEEEVENLKCVLEAHGIYFSFFTPEDITALQKDFKNHQIIFMDFSLDDSKTDPVININYIRKTLKKICNNNFGSYGLVLWTKHIENIHIFKEKLSIDSEKKEYITPLFVVGLDKLKYIQNGYVDLWEDLNTELRENRAALFFFNWRYSVERASDNALNNMYQLVPNYAEQAQQFPYLLYQMAENYSGIPTHELKIYDGMYKDAYRAFDELLYSDLISQQSGLENVFPEQITKPDYTFDSELKQIAKINSKLLLDVSINNQNIVMPGNVYQIIKDNGLLKLESFPKKHNPIPIAIELTPPCDFSHKKISSRLVGGFMIDCPDTKEKINEYKEKTYRADSKYLVWPIFYNEAIKFICFDFRNIYVEKDEALKDISSFKLMFSVKHQLFADILQKFSSHAARLGLPIIQPDVTIPKGKE